MMGLFQSVKASILDDDYSEHENDKLKTNKPIKSNMLDYYEGLRDRDSSPVVTKSILKPSDGDRKGRKLSMIVSNTQPVRAKYRKTSFAGYGETIQEITPNESVAPSRKNSIDAGQRSRRISRDANTIFATPHQSKVLEVCCEDVNEESQAFINLSKIPGSSIQNPLQSNILRNYLALVALRKVNGSRRKLGSHKRYWSNMESEERAHNDSLEEVSSESEDLEEINDRLNKEIQRRCYSPSRNSRGRSDSFDSGPVMKSRDLGKVYEELQRSASFDLTPSRVKKNDEFIEMPEQAVQKRMKNRENNIMAPLSF